MKSVFSLIAKQQPKTFKVSYAPDYKNFIVNHVLIDPSHPLHETQKRRQAERKKEGLWWHATTGVDLNKSSCVRAWARRRLRNAIKDELRERGYDENGMFVDLKSVQGRPDLMRLLQAGQTLNLSGSLRLHVQPPLIPAKYADVRAETGHVIEAVVMAKNGAGDFGSIRQTKRRPDFTSPRDAQWPPPKKRSQHVKQRVA